MKITNSHSNNYMSASGFKRSINKIQSEVGKTIEKLPAKVKHSALVAMFLLPVGAGIYNCSKSYSDNAQEIYMPVDTTFHDNYVRKINQRDYVVQQGDNPTKIAREQNVSYHRFMNLNNLKKGDIIHENQILKLPEVQYAENLESLDDVAKFMGFSRNHLNEVTKFETKSDTIYKDCFANPTIGIGHYIKPDELDKYKGRHLSDKEKYTLFAQDLNDADLDLKSGLDHNAYVSMPQCIRESLVDYAFSKGPGVVFDNENLKKAINNKDYENVINNITQDYSVVTDKYGNKKHRPRSGLSKRRLYNISHAAKYYNGDIPNSILSTAKAVYDRGLVYMSQEAARGEYPGEIYKNVLQEYKDSAYSWFDGKIGESSIPVTPEKPKMKTEPKENASTGHVAPKPNINGNKKVYVDGGKPLGITSDELYSQWCKNAEALKRPIKRPYPEMDANGNIVAYTKVLDPIAKSGALKGKTLIINAGHGGAMNTTTYGELNARFDPGTSNAVMSKKNKKLETNEFIGNNGIALEEWVVNKNMAEDLAEKARKQGAKVIYVQGSVYSAHDAINKLVNKHKVDAMVSLHSNSAGNSRGVLVIHNFRKGVVDQQDKAYAIKIKNKMDENSWFRGIVKRDSSSLHVLSKDKYSSLEIPAVLVETGNLKNKTDIANLNSSKFRDYMTDAILSGTIDYLKNKK